MSKPPHQVQIVRLRRLKHWSVPGIAKHLGLDQGFVMSVLWPRPCLHKEPEAPTPTEPLSLRSQLCADIVQLYRNWHWPVKEIAHALGLSEALVRRVLGRSVRLNDKTHVAPQGGRDDQPRA